jgi:hypothetical protein
VQPDDQQLELFLYLLNLEVIHSKPGLLAAQTLFVLTLFPPVKACHKQLFFYISKYFGIW